MAYYDVLNERMIDVDEVPHGVAGSRREGTETLRIDHGVKPSPVSPKRRDDLLHLVQQLFLDTSRGTLKQVLFCGVDTNDSSEVCAAAGMVLAEQTAGKVCLVDANIHDAQISRLFQLAESSRGARSGAQRLQCTRVDKNVFVAGTSFLGDGRGNLAPLNELRPRIAMLANTFEYLLFHAAGVNTSTDPLILGQAIGAAVLVLASHATRRDAARKAKSRLELGSTRVLGTVLT